MLGIFISQVRYTISYTHHPNFSAQWTLNALLIITIIEHNGSPQASSHSLLIFSAMCIPFSTIFLVRQHLH